MSLIKWKPDFETGIKTIDSQHKMLVDMINELYNSILEGKGLNALDDILTGLYHYSEKHFETEENFFEEYDYPDSYDHVQEHQEFIKKVSDIFEKLKKGEVVLSVEITKFLRDWLINHVMGSDQKYAPYLKEKGVN